jgi:dihydrofolate reductase
MAPRIELVVAMDLDRRIGDGVRMPWHLPADLRRFRALTRGKTVIMGRKTYESIGKPLRDRTNIVLTRDPAWTGANWVETTCRRYGSIREALASAGEDLTVIGGAEIYRSFANLASVVHATIIEAHVEGHVFFPDLDTRVMRKDILERREPDERNAYPMRFETWHLR